MIKNGLTVLAIRNTVSYLPYLGLVAVICSFGSLMERDRLAQFVLFVACLVIGGATILLSLYVGFVSTGISHLILSTVNFTLPVVR
jgi:hypothetical protein